jgi:tripartite-type tricarboxylate transporter receptor subunit TctC
MRNLIICLLVSCFAWSPNVSANLDLSGKTVTWIIPFKEGGGTSRFARFLQPFLTKYLPGNPTVQIQHIPGGGAIKGSNYFQKNAKTDGTYLFGCSTSVIVNVATGNPLVEYNLGAYEPVLLLPQNTHWFTRSDLASGTSDISKLKDSSLVLYALKTPASADLFHVWVFDKLGIKNARPIPGLSSGDGYQAFLRGEIHLSSHGAANYVKKVKPEIEKGKVVDVMTLGIVNDDGSISRNPLAPDVLTFPEMYEKANGKKLDGADLEAYYSIAAAWAQASKSVLLPEGTPDTIVKAYRDAVLRMMDDPEFKEKATKVLGPYPLIVGDAAGPILKKAAIFSDSTKKQLNAVLKKNGYVYRVQ